MRNGTLIQDSTGLRYEVVKQSKRKTRRKATAKSPAPKPRKGQKSGLANARKINGKYYAKVKAGKFTGGTHFVMREVKASSVKTARKNKKT